MQTDKKGNIVNAPQFLIHGWQRRLFKKAIAHLRQKMMDEFALDDMISIYGGPRHKDDELNELYQRYRGSIERIQELLKLPHGYNGYGTNKDQPAK